MMLSEGLDAVSKMIRGYANGGATAGKSYIGAIAEILCTYPRQVATACADPLTGVVTTTRFLPTPADIVGWCEPHVQAMAGKVKKAEEIERQFEERAEFEQTRPLGHDPIPPGCRANLFISATAPKYEALAARAANEDPRNSYREPGRDGIWIPLGWFMDEAAIPKNWKRFTVNELRDIYARNEPAPQPEEPVG